jgi:hypothetical protein
VRLNVLASVSVAKVQSFVRDQELTQVVGGIGGVENRLREGYLKGEGLSGIMVSDERGVDGDDVTRDRHGSRGNARWNRGTRRCRARRGGGVGRNRNHIEGEGMAVTLSVFVSVINPLSDFQSVVTRANCGSKDILEVNESLSAWSGNGVSTDANGTIELELEVSEDEVVAKSDVEHERVLDGDLSGVGNRVVRHEAGLLVRLDVLVGEVEVVRAEDVVGLASSEMEGLRGEGLSRERVRTA